MVREHKNDITKWLEVSTTVIKLPKPVHYYALFGATVGTDTCIAIYDGNGIRSRTQVHDFRGRSKPRDATETRFNAFGENSECFRRRRWDQKEFQVGSRWRHRYRSTLASPRPLRFGSLNQSGTVSTPGPTQNQPVLDTAIRLSRNREKLLNLRSERNGAIRKNQPSRRS